MAWGSIMPIQVVAYFTAGAYAEEAARLRESLDELGMDYRLYPLAGNHTWSSAVGWKPNFIAECLYNLPAEYAGILYTDADSVFKRIPAWEIFDPCDLAFHRFKRSPNHPLEYLTGTMYFKRTDAVIAFVDEWVKATPAYAGTFTPEQDSLKAVFGKHKRELVYIDPGPELCWIWDDFPQIYGKRNPVVVHYQASRKYRHAT